MNTAEAALIAGRTKTTILNWIATGRLTAGGRRISRPPWAVWDISETDLAAAIAAQRMPGRPRKTTSPKRKAVKAAMSAEGETTNVGE